MPNYYNRKQFRGKGLDRKRHYKRLQQAITVRSASVLRVLLIKRSTDINLEDQNGTLLHNAVFQNWPQGVALLLEKGADVNVQGPEDITPLHCCCLSANVDILRILLDNGAIVDSVDIHNQTPLNLAINNNFELGVNLLLDRGADLNIACTGGNTPFLSACMLNWPKAEMLLEKGPDVNHQNSCGFTALHYAVINLNEPLVRSLLRNGASVNVQNCLKCTPIYYSLSKSMYFDKWNVFEELLNWGSWLHITICKVISDSIIYNFINVSDKLHDILKRQMMKLKYAGISLEYNDYGDIIEALNCGECISYREACLVELSKIKSIRIGQQSLFDIFSK